MAILPIYVGLGQQMMIQEGILEPDVPLPDFPPAELVVKHIKPNFVMAWRDQDKLYIEAYSSVPEISSSVGVAGVLVALLLPAVQSAREAAIRAQYRDLPGPYDPEEPEEGSDPLPQPLKRSPLPEPGPQQ
ncbi:MAG: hypothetical protein R3C11_13480 [Planctomycetaceae bacterium]